MTLAFVFWFVMLFWLVLGGVAIRRDGWKATSTDWLPFVAMCLVGWGTFGAPIK